jgi:hypothetical protein
VDRKAGLNGKANIKMHALVSLPNRFISPSTVNVLSCCVLYSSSKYFVQQTEQKHSNDVNPGQDSIKITEIHEMYSLHVSYVHIFPDIRKILKIDRVAPNPTINNSEEILHFLYHTSILHQSRIDNHFY